MKTWKIAAAAVAVFGAAGSAYAQSGGFYVQGFAGVDLPDDEQLNGFNAANQLRDIDVKLEEGEVVGLAAGYAGKDESFGRIRGEVEFAFRKSDLEGLNLNGVARTIGQNTDVSVTSGLVNIYYDTPKLWERVRFSAGAGFGLANIDHQIRYLVANSAATGGNLQIAIPNSESTYAYQLIGGAELELSPRWSLTADVRYFDVGDFQAERYIGNTIINGVATSNGTLDSILDAEWKTTSVTVGLRFKF